MKANYVANFTKIALLSMLVASTGIFVSKTASAVPENVYEQVFYHVPGCQGCQMLMYCADPGETCNQHVYTCYIC